LENLEEINSSFTINDTNSKLYNRVDNLNDNESKSNIPFNIEESGCKYNKEENKYNNNDNS
jgi:hypothetical protein